MELEGKSCGNWKAVAAEIRKCVVRCSNCHMKKTANDFGYYTAL